LILGSAQPPAKRKAGQIEKETEVSYEGSKVKQQRIRFEVGGKTFRCRRFKVDRFVKSPFTSCRTRSGIQNLLKFLDSPSTLLRVVSPSTLLRTMSLSNHGFRPNDNELNF
jgi:hypothetical protein